jgi:hypothetical protein
MKTRLTAVNYDTLPYAKQRASDILNDWGYSKHDIIVTDNVNNRAHTSLFGDNLATELWINDKNAMTTCVDMLTDDTDGTIGNGMVIMFSMPETSKQVKALRSLIDKSGGTYEHPRKNADGEISSIMEKANLNPVTRKALLDYVGKDYTILLPIVKGLAEVPLQDQKKLSFDELMMRIPQGPGECSIWGDWKSKDPGLDGFILNHNRGAALSRLERLLVSGSAPVAIIGFLKSKFGLMFRLKAMLINGNSQEQVAEALGLPNPKYSGKNVKDPKTGKSGYPTKQSIQNANKYSVVTLARIMEDIEITEAIIKGQHPTIKLDPHDALYSLVAKLA